MEVFNQKRMDRCAAIQRAIMDNWQRSNSFACTVRATDSVEGITLDDLRTRYFAVGVGDDLTEIPFTDVLVILSMIEQEWAALEHRKDKSETEFSIDFQVTTDWPDEEAVRLLSGIQIETPFDTGTHLRISADERPADEAEGDQQT